MPFTLKFDNDTGLCGRCEHSTITDDIAGHTVVTCHWFYPVRNILIPLARCTSFEAKGALTKEKAEKIGWVLESKGNAIGFKPPAKDKDHEIL